MFKTPYYPCSAEGFSGISIHGTARELSNLKTDDFEIEDMYTCFFEIIIEKVLFFVTEKSVMVEKTEKFLKEIEAIKKIKKEIKKNKDKLLKEKMNEKIGNLDYDEFIFDKEMSQTNSEEFGIFLKEMADFYASNMIYFMLHGSQTKKIGIFNKIIKQIFGFEKLSFESEECPIEIKQKYALLEDVEDVCEIVKKGKEMVNVIKETQSFSWTEEELKMFEKIDEDYECFF